MRLLPFYGGRPALIVLFISRTHRKDAVAMFQKHLGHLEMLRIDYADTQAWAKGFVGRSDFANTSGIQVLRIMDKEGPTRSVDDFGSYVHDVPSTPPC